MSKDVTWTESAKNWLGVLNELKDQEIQVKRAIFKYLDSLAKANQKPMPSIKEIDWTEFNFEQIEHHKNQIKKKIMDELEKENGWYKAKHIFFER